MSTLWKSFGPLLVLAISGLPAILLAQEVDTRPDRDWAMQFGGAALSIEVMSGNRTSTAELIGIQGGELELRPGDALNPGERVFIPLDDIQEFKLVFSPNEEQARTLERLRSDEATDPADVADLRATVWPMVQYLPLPEEHFNIHPLVNDYLQALLDLDLLDEAYAMILEIPLARVNPAYVQYTLTLANKLVEADLNTRGLALLGIVPLQEEDEELLRILIRYARDFREQDELDEALILYDRIRSLPHSPVYKEALLWTAYCNVRLDRVESARLFLQEARPIEPRDPEFSLHQLVLARIALADQKFRKAMEEVSQGVVFSRIGFAWVPELLYVSGICYQALGEPHTAANVFGQLQLFFPSQKWAERGQERLHDHEAAPAPPQPLEESPTS